MSIRLTNSLRELNSLETPNELDYDKFFTDTLMVYPEGFDPNGAVLKKPCYRYGGDIFDLDRSHKSPKGGLGCSVCLEDKPARSMYFCRLCGGGLCAGCWTGCKTANTTHDSISITASNSSGNYPARDQPRCPTCRGEGTYGSQGLQATRVIQFTEQGRKYTFGPPPTIDHKLKEEVRLYIKEYNKVIRIVKDKIDKDKVIYADNIMAIEADETYNDMETQINKQEQLIMDMEQTIREIRGEVYNLKHRREEYVKDKLVGPIIVGATWYKDTFGEYVGRYTGGDHMTLSNLCKAMSNNYARRFFSPRVNDGTVNCDYQLADKCMFGKFGHRKTGGWFEKLDNLSKSIGERMTQICGGAIMPEAESVADMEKFSDSELEAQIKAMTALMEARKGGGGAKPK